MPLYTESYEYKECEAIEGVFHPAKYKLEAWGAGAGDATGGYACGEIYIKYAVPYFIHIGSSPIGGNPSEGGCNGGGRGSSNKSRTVYGGGDATDIRSFEDTYTIESLLQEELVDVMVLKGIHAVVVVLVVMLI